MAKSAIGSAFGFISTITSRIIGGVKLRQAEEAILSLSEDTIKQLTDEFVQKLIVVATGVTKDCYRIFVDYTQSPQQMVAAGCYDWVSSDIAEEDFLLEQETGTTWVDAELIHFNRYIGSDEALKELDRLGYRAGTAKELLTFGAVYLDKQKEFPIVALGTVRLLRGRRLVLILWSDESRRDLGLSFLDDDWNDDCRFLAMRK